MDISEIRRAIQEYDFGDLVAGAEILDSLEELKTQGMPSEELPLFDALMNSCQSMIAGKDVDQQVKRAEVLGFVDQLSDRQNAHPSSKSPEGAREQLSVDMEVLGSFLAEAAGHLDDIEERILLFEKEGDPLLVNDIFRSVHTIKGVSSFLNLPEIKKLAHNMEFMLDDLRNAALNMSSEICDTLLEATDVLGALTDELQLWYDQASVSGSADIPKTSILIDGIIEKIEAGRRAPSSDPQAPVGSMASEATGTSGENISVTPTDGPTSFSFHRPSAPPLPEGYGDLFTDEMIISFLNESAELMDAVESAILNLEKQPGEKGFIDEAFRAVHTVKGNAGFFQYADVEQLCMGLESFLDTFRNQERRVDQASITTMLSAVDALRSGLVMPDGIAGPANKDEGMKLHPDAEEPAAPARAAGIGEILVEMGVVDEEKVQAALRQQSMKVGEILVQQGSATEQDVSQALKKQGERPQVGQESLPQRRKKSDIRVDTERLDSLFNLVGELITAEGMVVNNPDLDGLVLENFRRSGGILNKITREIQEVTMAIRMIPLDGLFNKMRRLIRDLSRKFQKEIVLRVSGEDTEMDRNVIDEVSDPLVHIIRNAIDHGIEPVQERMSAGKRHAGHLSLGARYEGNEIWISIKDDGRGLHREKILAKALERGIINDPSREMSDEEIYQLIFEPGFSTAEQVSEISGRGVGMDVVKKNIEKLRGKVEVRSTHGEGTEFILKIPLTLAIIDGIVFTVRGALFSLPLTDILEFQKSDPSGFVETDRGKRVLNIRGELYPIIDMAEFYGLQSETDDEAPGRGLVILAQGRGKRVALLVDQIIGNHQLVLKALPEYMGKVKAVSGCSIMGGGEVCLIIDSGTLVSLELE